MAGRISQRTRRRYLAICAKNFKWLTMLVVRLTDRPIAPSLSGNLQCIDIQVVPPSSYFTANLMQLLVTAATKRKNKFVADFRTEGSELNKTLIVRIQWRQQPRPSANAKVAEETGYRARLPASLIIWFIAGAAGGNAAGDFIEEELRFVAAPETRLPEHWAASSVY